MLLVMLQTHQLSHEKNPYFPLYWLFNRDPCNPKNPWDVIGCQDYLFGGPRGVTRRVWCFHGTGQEPSGMVYEIIPT